MIDLYFLYRIRVCFQGILIVGGVKSFIEKIPKAHPLFSQRI